MALRGRAFMAVWHDIASTGEAEYNTWHTRQHMPERLGVPGVGSHFGVRMPIEETQ
jgi:hypothetical protein